MSRTAFVCLLSFGLCALAGCSMGVWQEDGSSTIIPAGNDAALVARSRAHVNSATIEKLQDLRDAANAQRLELRDQADNYRTQAATALSQPTHSRIDRTAYAKQYAEFADQLDREAAIYAKRADAYASRMALLENTRQRRLQNAQKYDHVRVALPQ